MTTPPTPPPTPPLKGSFAKNKTEHATRAATKRPLAFYLGCGALLSLFATPSSPCPSPGPLSRHLPRVLLVIIVQMWGDLYLLTIGTIVLYDQFTGPPTLGAPKRRKKQKHASTKKSRRDNHQLFDMSPPGRPTHPTRTSVSPPGLRSTLSLFPLSHRFCRLPCPSSSRNALPKPRQTSLLCTRRPHRVQRRTQVERGGHY